MEMLILKTDINTKEDFKAIRTKLKYYYKIKECTIDLEDIDKVVRVVGDNIELNDVVNKIKSFGFLCEDLPN